MTNDAPGHLGGLDRRLLRVCFLPAVAARREWEEQVAGTLRVVDLPPGSHGLLPLLHRRLVELDLASPDLDRLHGVRRRMWVQNEMRLRTTRAALDLLGAVGAEPALLGGAAVLVAHHRRSDLRALHDVDLLVRSDHVDEAIEALAAAGWTIGHRWRGGYLLDVHGVRTTDRDGGAVSLRWSSAASSAEAIERATTVAMGAGSARCVSSADLLAYTILDGSRTHLYADALTILRDDHLDVDRLTALTDLRQGSAAVAMVLRRLHDVVPSAVPAAVEPLMTADAPWHRRHVLDPDRRPSAVRAYLRRNAGSSWPGAVGGFPAFLCEVWGVGSVASLPGEVARRARRRRVATR